jgi:hypothetical protein
VFLAYTLVAPFYRTRLPHWPFLAYLALLPFVPAVLIGFVDAARTAAGRRGRAALVALGPLIALLGAAGVSAYHLAWAHPELVPEPRRGRLQTQMEDWRALEPALARPSGGRATGSAASPRWPPPAISRPPAGVPRRTRAAVFALNEPYDFTTRFRLMRASWAGRAGPEARRRPGRGVVVVLPEPTYLYHTPEEVAFRRRLCGLFEAVEPVQTVELPPGPDGGRALHRPRAQRALARRSRGLRLLPPPVPRRPERAEVVAAATSTAPRRTPRACAGVEILLDGFPAAPGARRARPRGRPRLRRAAVRPAWPRVQFDFQLPADLTPGAHRIAVRATTGDGRTLTGAERTIYVE